MSHALEHLAWAALPERAIHRRLANQLLRTGRAGHRFKGPSLSKVKEAVRETLPPRGFLQKRTDGTAAEMVRQKVIREKRSRFAPYVKGRITVQERRNTVAYGRIGDHLGTCHDVRSIPGHALYLASTYMSYHSVAYVYVRHFATGATDVIPVSDKARTVANAIFLLHEKEIGRVVQNGGFYTVDFCRAVTTLQPLDGPSVDLFWLVESTNHPLPRKSCCGENRA